MIEKCDWCGKKAVAETGRYVYRYGERLGKTCERDHTLAARASVIFKNEEAWLWWKNKHPKLAQEVLTNNGPKFRYYLKDKNYKK